MFTFYRDPLDNLFYLIKMSRNRLLCLRHQVSSSALQLILDEMLVFTLGLLEEIDIFLLHLSYMSLNNIVFRQVEILIVLLTAAIVFNGFWFCQLLEQEQCIVPLFNVLLLVYKDQMLGALGLCCALVGLFGNILWAWRRSWDFQKWRHRY